ncbi:MAG: c-type cytochrome [Methylococcaceae bacterium]
MSMRKCVMVLVLVAGMAHETALAASMEGPKLGVPATSRQIAERDISVFPDGTGLPLGTGTVAQGQVVYETQCAFCHGPKGIGGSAEELVGRGRLDGPTPDKSVGNYWPYATTIFDFVRRSMPLHAPGSLSDGQVYAVTAYLLYLNGLIAADAVLSSENLSQVVMPNRNGFVQVWPETAQSSN